MYTDLYSKMDNAHWTMAQMANEQGPFCCIYRYTSDTHGVKEFQSYTAKTALNSAIQRYTALYSIQYTAIHRYTLYNLYITPLLATHTHPRPVVVVVVVNDDRKPVFTPQ